MRRGSYRHPRSPARPGPPAHTAAPLALWTVLALGVTPLAAQEPAGDRLLWTAASLQRLLADRDYPTVLLLSALGHTVGVGDRLPLESAGSLLDALTEGGARAVELDRCRRAEDPLEGALCSLEILIPLAPSEVSGHLAEEGARLLALFAPGSAGALSILPPRSPAGGISPFTTPFALPISASGMAVSPTLLGGAVSAIDPFQRFAESTLTELWRIREDGVARIEGFTPSLDEVLDRLLGFSPAEAPGEILARAPELRSLLNQYPLLAAREELSRAPEALLGEYRAFLGSLTGGLGEALAGVGLPADFSAGAEHAGGTLGWAAERSLSFLASEAAASLGLESGVVDRIRTLGGAAADLRLGASSFGANLLATGREAALAALGGNVLGVAANLTAFFGIVPGGMGPGAAAELRAMREGMESMRVGLESRLDGVDVRLDGILSTLDARFTNLEGLVAINSLRIAEESRAIQDEVARLSRRVDRVEESLHGYMQAGFDRDYNRTLVRCLEHRERVLPPFDEMEFPLFAECLTDFRTRAVRDSRDALLTDQSTPLDDPSLAAALADLSVHNLARRLPLLGRVADRRYGYAGLRGGGGIANPMEWAVAAQAYMAMLEAWPNHARSVSPGDLEAIYGVGLDLVNALQSLTLDGATGNRGELLRRVLAGYEGEVARLTEEADLLARRHQQAQLRRFPASSILNRIDPADRPGPSLDVPQTIAFAVPQEARTSAILGLGEATLVYRLTTEDRSVRENFRRRLVLFGRRHDRLTSTRTHIEVELRVAGHGTIARYRAVGPWVHRLTEEMSGNETSEEVVSTRVHVADAGAHFLAEHWPAVAADREAWQTAFPSPLVVQALENGIDTELRRHGSVAVDNVFSAVCAGNGSAPEMSGEDRASALRIREALEGLTTSRLLFDAYVRLALPGSLHSDPRLRDSLDGPDAILDRNGLCTAFAAGENPLRLVWLEEEPRRRLGGLTSALDSVLSIDAALAEPLLFVGETLQRLETALRLQRLRTLVARTAQQ